MAKPRLFVETIDPTINTLTLSGNAHHYLTRVMRLNEGDDLVVFDGQSDSRNAKITNITKRALELCLLDVERALLTPPNLTLAFAPIKKSRTDFIIEKAAELGVRHIQPIKTLFTNSERINPTRLNQHIIEAIEQCGGNFIPTLHDWMPLSHLLAQTQDQLLFCDETALNGEGEDEFTTRKAPDWTILIGPEGGFSPNERDAIVNKGAIRLSLGPRVLRADTAAVAALTLWQATHGDWR